MKKRILALVMATVIAGSCFMGCGNTAKNEDSSQGGNKDTAQEAESQKTPEETQADSGETYELKMAMTSTSMTFAADIADLIKEATDGRVTVTVIDASTMGGAADCLNMARAGALDLLMLPAAQTPGEFPISDIVQVPFFVPDATCGEEVMYALSEAGYLTEYENGTVPLFYATTDSQMLGFKENIVAESTQDFKGMKIRAVSGITTNFVEDVLGATVVTMGMNDVYLSLNTGVIDAAFSSPVQMVSNSFADVMGSVMDYPCYVGLLYCVANEAKWNSLPADIQEGIKEACETKRQQILEYYAAKESESLETLKENGVNVYEPNEALVTELVNNSEALQGVFEENLNQAGLDGAAIMNKAREVIEGYTAK